MITFCVTGEMSFYLHNYVQILVYDQITEDSDISLSLFISTWASSSITVRNHFMLAQEFGLTEKMKKKKKKMHNDQSKLESC